MSDTNTPGQWPLHRGGITSPTFCWREAFKLSKYR